MLEDIEKIILTEEELRVRIRELAAEISRDYEGKDPLFVGVLKGSYIFMADLCKNVTIPCEMAFITASSYRGTQSSGNVRTDLNTLPPLEGRHVVLVEDIIDSGLTLKVIGDSMKSQGAASLEICALLDKPSRRINDLRGKYVGFAIPDEFVVGFGLDYRERYRNLPFVGVLRPEVYGA